MVRTGSQNDWLGIMLKMHVGEGLPIEMRGYDEICIDIRNEWSRKKYGIKDIGR